MSRVAQPEWCADAVIAADRLVNHYPEFVKMAILGEGVMPGWRHMIDDCLAEGLLVRATRESASHGGGCYVLSPDDRAQNRAARLFHDGSSSRQRRRRRPDRPGGEDITPTDTESRAIDERRRLQPYST